MEQITLEIEGRDVAFFVLEQTVLNGRTYILVTEEETGDADAFVLRDDSSEEDADALYTFVEEEEELAAVGGIFEKLLSDDDIGIETGGK